MYVTKFLCVIEVRGYEVYCMEEINGISRQKLEWRIYLDSCTSSQVCIVTSPDILTVVNPNVLSINLTEEGKSMSRTHIGSRARKDICSLTKLESIGL